MMLLMWLMWLDVDDVDVDIYVDVSSRFENCKHFRRNVPNILNSERCKSWNPKQNSVQNLQISEMLQNEYSLAKIGLDTAENELLKVWGSLKFQYRNSNLSRNFTERRSKSSYPLRNAGEGGSLLDAAQLAARSRLSSRYLLAASPSLPYRLIYHHR